MKHEFPILASFENEELFLNTIKYLSDVIDSRDVYTLGHSERVQRYSMRIGEKLKLSSKKMDILYLSSILHDIGKVKVPIEILKSGKKLNKYEFSEMKRHPIYGAYLLGSFRYVSGVQEAIRHHHERYDGKGYPDGLKEKQIPLYSRIIAVCDAFDAMTSNRSYIKEIKNERYAIEEIRHNSGTQFDPDIAEIFIELFENGYIHLEKGLYFAEHNSRESVNLAEFLLGKAIEKLPKGIDRETAQYTMGRVYMKIQKFPEALSKFKRYLKYNDNEQAMAAVYNNMASAYYNLEEYDKSLYYNEKVYSIRGAYLEKARAYRYKARVYFDMGKDPHSILTILDKSEKMHRLLESRIEKRKNNIISKHFSITRYNKLINFTKKLQMDNAKYYDILAFIMYHMADFESAQKYYLKSINLKHFHGDLYGSIRSQAGIAMLYMDLNRFRDAEFNLLESMNMAQHLDDRPGLRMVYNNLGRLYMYWKKPQKAKMYYRKAFKMACELDRQAIATESCRYLINSSKSAKTRKKLKKQYLSLYTKNKKTTLSGFFIHNNDRMTDKRLKEKYLHSLDELDEKYRMLEYAKTYYMLMKFLKRTNDEEYEKYRKKIPEITAKLSDSMVKRRLKSIYGFSKKVSSNNRPEGI